MYIPIKYDLCSYNNVPFLIYSIVKLNLKSNSEVPKGEQEKKSKQKQKLLQKIVWQ